MDSSSFVNQQSEKLLNAQAHVWNHIFCFHHSMALKCALELGIPDAIHKHGSPIILPELAKSLAIHPTKIPALYRLMRLLVESNYFSNQLFNGEDTFALTINSQVLLKDHPLTLAPFALGMLEPTMINPSHKLASWLQNDVESPFHIAYGKSFWEHTGVVPKFNEYFNQAMASDARFVASLLVKSPEFKGLFEGIESLVDVGGGNGTTAKVIADAYPGLKCTVLDLPHVVEGLEDNGLNLVYIAGDMFEPIPPANAVFMKWILHDWSDDHCIKILQRCKEAIPSRGQGGKVVIVDIVVKTQKDFGNHFNTQLLFDMEMMSLNIGGKERNEIEWKQLFNKAGFDDYKIFPLLGVRSVIEVYPA